MRPYAAIASCPRCESRPEHRRRIIKAAHARPRHQRANPVGDGSQGLRLSLHPAHHAGRAKPIRAEEVGERLGRPVLGDQLLHMEIDGRRAQALAILGRRADPSGKGRRRPAAAAGAGIDQTPMLGDLDQLRRQVEHLAPLRLMRHRPRQASPAMAARAGFMGHDPVRLGDPLERIALMTLLSAAGFGGRLAKAHRFLPQPVARRRLRTRRTVKAELALQIRVLRAQGRILSLKLRHPAFKRLDPALKSLNENPNLGRNVHPHLESQELSSDTPKSNPRQPFLPIWIFLARRRSAAKTPV